MFKTTKRFIDADQKSVGEILLYDSIGGDWFGGVTAKQVSDEIRALGDVDSLEVRINSPGGDVFEGYTIYNTLLRHPAHVDVLIDGLAASIASVVAMAGSTITMAENSMMMIHDPWGVAVGDAGDLRRQADTLDSIRGQILDTYARKASANRDDISAMMDEETWLTAAEAVGHGLADAVFEPERLAAMVIPPALAAKYKHLPVDVLDPTPRLDARRARLAALTQ